MRIGVPRETKPGRDRVALTPFGARRFAIPAQMSSWRPVRGRPAGSRTRNTSTPAPRSLRRLGGAWSADLVLKVKEPLPPEYPYLSQSSALFTFLHLAALPGLTEELLTRRVTAVAYETVTSSGALPILRPMSEVAGILSIQVGARGLEKGCGGRGVLLPGTEGSPPGDVTVLGAGVAGRNAARIAAGIGANVTILDVNLEKLEVANGACGGKARTIRSTPEAVAAAVKETDLSFRPCWWRVSGRRAW